MDDGRNYLLTTRKKYDVDHGRHHPAASRRRRRAVLARVLSSWCEARSTTTGSCCSGTAREADTTYRLILRTFLSVFPHTTLWADGTLMVGSLKPFDVQPERLRAALPGSASSASCSTGDYDTLAETYLAGPPEVKNWVGDGPILTDDKPTIEYFLSLPRDEGPRDLSGIAAPPDGHRASVGALREPGARARSTRLDLSTVRIRGEIQRRIAAVDLSP